MYSSAVLDEAPPAIQRRDERRRRQTHHGHDGEQPEIEGLERLEQELDRDVLDGGDHDADDRTGHDRREQHARAASQYQCA